MNFMCNLKEERVHAQWPLPESRAILNLLLWHPAVTGTPSAGWSKRMFAHCRVGITVLTCTARMLQNGELVAQFKATVLLMPNGSDRVTSAPLQKLETEKTVIPRSNLEHHIFQGEWTRLNLDLAEPLNP